VSGILILILGNNKPSSRLRLLQAVDFLKSRGHEVTVQEIGSGFYSRLGMLAEARKHDLVLLQKKLLQPWLLRMLARANPNLIFDCDDAIMFHELERGEPLRGDFFRRFVLTAATARGVIVGNNYLADFARAARSGSFSQNENRDVLVLPTAPRVADIPAKVYEKKDTVTVGWIGTKGNLRQLHHIADALRDAYVEVPGLRLKVVCDVNPEIHGLPVEFKHWSKNDEVVDLHSFDIGVMPLEDNLWTRGKGGYKLLQYLAAGVPAIASPVGINAEILRHGENGLLAKGSVEWCGALVNLARDASLRERLGQAGRRTVEEGYSFEHYQRRLADFLEGYL
jgi:glycosyltransferase involved in cell wall biosynthesis